MRGVLNVPAAIVDIRNLSYAVNKRAVFAGLDMQIQRGRGFPQVRSRSAGGEQIPAVTHHALPHVNSMPRRDLIGLDNE